MSESEPRTILPVKARDLPGTHAAEGCRKCACEDGYLAQYIKVNGTAHLRWVCDFCEDYYTSGDLPHTMLGDFPLSSLPVRINRAAYDTDRPECVVCGLPAGEWHHWAPRSLFPSWADQGVYLCTPHHREWHDVMRAHGLRYPHELQDVS